MGIFKKTALSICISVFLVACGGGGGDSGAPPSPTFNIITDAGIDRKSALGYTAILNGSKSTVLSSSGATMSGEALAYEWKLIEKPSGSNISTVNIQDSKSSSAKFTPDIEGLYKFQLTVSLKGVLKSDDVVIAAAQPLKLTLSDTGQTASFTDVFGEDGDYSGVTPNVIDNGNGTVTDKITGLTWQKDSDGNMYNWYQAQGKVDAGYNLSGDGFIDACGNSRLGGFSDWRLPVKHEAMTIVNYGDGKRLLWNSITASSGYWLVDGGFFVLGIIGSGGFVHTENAVLCVRGEKLVRNDIANNLDGTASDIGTGLMWQYPLRKETSRWEDAIKYCEGLELNGFSDWRLPNIRELSSVSNPAVKATHDKVDARIYYSDGLWSSTTSGGSYAFTVEHPDGNIKTTSKNLGVYSACVRTL